ncbi:MAG: threonine synthase [Bacteroidetes bacterium]|nr:threonine synthase [Bacteroidota bacterium]
MPEYTLNCFLCGKINDEHVTSTYCTSCGGVLTVNYQSVRTEIQYPLKSTPKDPLRSGMTELRYLAKLSARYDIEIWAKMELQNPSGCFKDRGSHIEVLKALELNREAICLASTGNMAASVAMYARYYEIPCYVFVPENTSEGKLAQANMFDATVLRIKGDFTNCEQLCKEFAKSGNYYLAGDYVYREEGQKSVSYEIIEQQNEEFDYVLIPVGCGTNFGAIHKGFKEAAAAGLIERIPRLVCVQPEKSSPVVEGIAKRTKIVKDSVMTMATAVAAADPIDFHKVLHGVDDTLGHASIATENSILESLREMAVTEGIFTEPACALPLSAIKHDIDLYRNKRCLLLLTGTGLKDTTVVTRSVLPSPILPNDVAQVLEYLDSGYPALQSESFGKPRDTVLTQIKFSDDRRRLYEDYLSRIGKKGKSLTVREREVLQTLVFNDDATLKLPVVVTDYRVIMQKNGLVASTVTAILNEQECETEHEGVGPLDSVLGAMTKLTSASFPVTLVNHHLEILGPGTNALVVASITLTHEGLEVEAKAASPDVIEAGLNAWVKAFSILYKKFS